MWLLILIIKQPLQDIYSYYPFITDEKEAQRFLDSSLVIMQLESSEYGIYSQGVWPQKPILNFSAVLLIDSPCL